ncbi:MAG: C4-type zinc ribbon domain-containing protein [bacterium]|nr:C4-type zinc ribbon domain-containing protein [bacterium]
MDNNLKQLVQLQKIDTQFLSFRAQLDELPQKLNQHRETLNTAIAKSDTAHREFEKLSKDKHTGEIDLKEDEENVKKFTTQQYAVKTNEQYNALKHEIALVKEKISKTEDTILELMDKIDIAKRTWDEEKKKIEEGKRVLAEEEKKSLAEESRLKSLIAELETQRKQIAETIEATLLASYQRISQRYKGLALVVVKGDVCQGCSMKLPPQVIAEVNKNDKIVRCENCARILYASEESEPETVQTSRQ